jgi:teichuronic acid biosynthesis glycosyltransferase TuaC
MNVLTLTNMYPYFRFPFFGMVVKEEIDMLRRSSVNGEVIFVNGTEQRSNYFTKFFLLRRLLATREFDIIHAHHTYCAYMAFISQMVFKKKIPVVLTLHEGEICHGEKVRYNIDFIEKLKYNKALKEFAMSKVDHVITVYDGLLKGLKHAPYSVLPCGVNLDNFKPLSIKACRETLHIPDSAKVIFFPNLPVRPEKRFDLVKKAFENLKKIYHDNLVLLTGGGIDYARMPVYFNASNVAILTSDYEASPMVIKEAMATNTPIVSVDVGDVKNIIAGVDGCYLVTHSSHDITDKLEKALEFNQRTNGRQRINALELSHEQVVAKTIKIYDQLISKN